MRCTKFPFWETLLPTLMMVIGFAIAYWFYIVNPEVPQQLAARNDWLYRFLLNKWYFDELYDFLFVRSSKWLGRFLWRRGDGWLIDGFGPDGVSAWVLDATSRVVRLQIRLPLPLRLRHADRRRAAGHLPDVRVVRIDR